MISVLYVDDETALLEVCKFFLERTGEFSVSTECSSPKALDAVRDGRYDAIVSDYQMPEMDGIEFLKKVRESGNSIPFIIFTGRGREEIAIAAFENGADFYLQKGGDAKAQFAELSHKIRKSVEQRQAKQALGESETRFRALIQNTSDIVSIFDRDCRIQYNSPAVSRILGYPENYLIGKKPGDFVHPEDWDRVKVELGEVYGKKNPESPSEYRLKTADGEYLWVESTAINLIGVPGVDGIVVTTRPIAERKSAEEALRKKHEELHAAFQQLSATEEELRQNYEELAKSQKQFVESEQKVRASEVFLSRVINDAREGITAYDRELRYILWNKFMENRTGIPAAEVLGNRGVEMFPFLKETGADRLQERALSGETVESSDFFFHIPQSGKEGWARVIYSPLYDTDGTILGVISIVQDITARKVMEQALQNTVEELMESEERYLSLFERSLDCIYIHDLEGNFIDANPAALALLGYTRDDIPHLSFTSLISREQIIKAREIIRTRIEGGSHPDLVEYRLRRKDGGFVDVETKGSLILHDEKPYAILGIARDITGRKRTEDLTRTMLRRLETLISSLYAGVMMVSEDGKVVHANQALCDLYNLADSPESLCGLTSHEMINKVLDYYTSPADTLAHILEMVTQGKPVKGHEISLRNGRIIMVDYIPIVDPNGQRRGRIWHHQDITDRKRTMEALASANKKLNLLSSVTRHDILNRVLALRSALDLIDTDHLDQETRKLIGIAEKAAETINGQIEFTKEYEHPGMKEPRWQNINTLFRHAALQFLMFDISLDMPTDEYEISADPLIEKVFYNLLDNALRHGGDLTRISLTYNETDAGLKIFVQDNGQGVTDEDKRRIFEQDFGRNTGLGLFLSREILSITGITIEETGTFGKGARFEITVPNGAYQSVVRP